MEKAQENGLGEAGETRVSISLFNSFFKLFYFKLLCHILVLFLLATICLSCLLNCKLTLDRLKFRILNLVPNFLYW